MPFDGATFRNPDVITVVALRDWLMTQDPAETYSYYREWDQCLVARFLKAQGVAFIGVMCMHWRDVFGELHRYPKGVEDIAILRPHTMGAALDRANRQLVLEARLS